MLNSLDALTIYFFKISNLTFSSGRVLGSMASSKDLNIYVDCLFQSSQPNEMNIIIISILQKNFRYRKVK